MEYRGTCGSRFRSIGNKISASLRRKRSSEMKKCFAFFLFLSLIAVTPASKASSVDTAKPEDVGLSSERLQRIHQTIQRHIDAGDISGAVTLVARRGRIAHFEVHGLMDIDSKRPMSKDA